MLKWPKFVAVGGVALGLVSCGNSSGSGGETTGKGSAQTVLPTPSSGIAPSAIASSVNPATAPASSAQKVASPLEPLPEKLTFPPAAKHLVSTCPEKSSTSAKKPAAATSQCRRTSLAPVLASPSESNSPVVVWEEQIAANHTVILPSLSGVEWALVLLEGEVQLDRGDGGHNKDHLRKDALTTWWVRDYGETHLTAQSAARVVIAAVSVDPNKAIAAISGNLRTVKVGPMIDTPKDLLATPVLRWGAGAFEARIGIESPSEKALRCTDNTTPTLACKPAMSMTFLRMSKDAEVAAHKHDNEWEVLWLFKGKGTLELGAENAGKGRMDEITAPTVVYIPPGKTHAWHPDGSQETQAIQFYAGPGPEQRFRAAARPKLRSVQIALPCYERSSWRNNPPILSQEPLASLGRILFWPP